EQGALFSSQRRRTPASPHVERPKNAECQRTGCLHRVARRLGPVRRLSIRVSCCAAAGRLHASGATRNCRALLLVELPIFRRRLGRRRAGSLGAPPRLALPALLAGLALLAAAE